MAITHPDARLARGLFEHLLVQHQGILELTDPAERGGLEVGSSLVVGLIGGDFVELSQRLFGAVLAVKHQREIGPRGGERGRQVERAAQQVFAILVAPDPPGKLGKQPDRRNVEWKLLQLRAQ